MRTTPANPSLQRSGKNRTSPHAQTLKPRYFPGGGYPTASGSPQSIVSTADFVARIRGGSGGGGDGRTSAGGGGKAGGWGGEPGSAKGAQYGK